MKNRFLFALQWSAPIALAFFGWWWLIRIPPEMTLSQARKRGLVAVGCAASRNPREIRLSVLVVTGRPIAIIIPAGTIFKSGKSGVQDLIAAQSVRVVFSGGLTRQTRELEQQVYCLNRFLSEPDADDSYEIVYEKPSTPVQKLTQCLEKHHSSSPAATRQIAVWMVSDDILNMTRGAAAAAFRQRFGAEYLRALKNECEVELRRAGASEEEIRQQIRDSETKLSASVNQRIESELRIQWSEVKPLLAGCGFPVENAPFFR